LSTAPGETGLGGCRSRAPLPSMRTGTSAEGGAAKKIDCRGSS
jgi:hypothetical protein